MLLFDGLQFKVASPLARRYVSATQRHKLQALSLINIKEGVIKTAKHYLREKKE